MFESSSTYESRPSIKRASAKKTLKKDRPSENKLRLSFLPDVPISLKEKKKTQRRVYFRFLSHRKISIVLISTNSLAPSCTLVENYKQIDRFLRNRIFQMNEQTDEAQCIFQFFLKKKKEKKTEWLVYTFLSFPDTMSH